MITYNHGCIAQVIITEEVCTAFPPYLIEGNADVAATADYIGQQTIFSGEDSARGLHIFAGNISLSAAFDLDDYSPSFLHAGAAAS